MALPMEIDFNLSSDEILAIIDRMYEHEPVPELTEEQHAIMMQSCFPVIKKHRARQLARKSVVKALGTLCVIMMAGIAIKQALLTPQINVAPETGGMAAVGHQSPPATLPATVTRETAAEIPITIPVTLHQSSSNHKTVRLYTHPKKVEIINDEPVPDMNAMYVAEPVIIPSNSEPVNGERRFAPAPDSDAVAFVTP